MSGIYRVYTKPKDPDAPKEQAFAGSMAQVREAKAALREKHDLGQKEVEHEELEITYNKAGVIEFLNANCSAAG